MAVKRRGWDAAATWREDLKKTNERLREDARQHKRSNPETVRHARTLEKALKENPNAYHDYDAVHYYYGENDLRGHNNARNSPYNQDKAKKVLEEAFSKDRKKNKIK